MTAILFRLQYAMFATVYFWRAYIEPILPKGPYLPCVSIAGRALLAGYPRYLIINKHVLVVCDVKLYSFSNYFNDCAFTAFGWLCKVFSFAAKSMSKILPRWLNYLHHRDRQIPIWPNQCGYLPKYICGPFPNNTWRCGALKLGHQSGSILAWRPKAITRTNATLWLSTESHCLCSNPSPILTTFRSNEKRNCEILYKKNIWT